MLGRRPSALSVLLASLLLAGACAQAAEPAAQAAWKHPLTNPPAAAPGVEILYWFPDHGRLQFPVGDKIDVVLGFHNGGDEPLNVSYVMGSINSPASFAIYVQNFSAQGYAASVAPGEDASLQYSFLPNKAIPAPREFMVALTAFYNNAAGQEFSTTFFNKTADIVEAPTWIDFELLGLYFGFVVALAGLGYLAFKWLSGFSWFRAQIKKRPAKAPAAPAAPVEGAENEWLKGTFYKGQQARARK